MMPQSHLLFPSPSIISHTLTLIPFLSRSPCPRPCLPVGPKSTRTSWTGGGWCPAIISRRGPWTSESGIQWMKVRSRYLKTGRWRTQKLEWFILQSKQSFYLCCFVLVSLYSYYTSLTLLPVLPVSQPCFFLLPLLKVLTAFCSRYRTFLCSKLGFLCPLQWQLHFSQLNFHSLFSPVFDVGFVGWY